MDREHLINFIPKPSNENVILYDTTLKNLIDIDVFTEYNKLLPVFNFSQQMFLGYKNNIENYEKALNNLFLYQNSWSEEDYLFHLQNEKKTYANLYGPIKKIESNIEILQKKIKMTDEKIEMQITKEKKEIEERKKNLDKRINDNVEKLLILKENLSLLKIEQEKLKESLKDNEEEFAELQLIVEGIENKECKCKYCGHKLSNVSKNSNYYKRTYKKILENKKELETLLNKKNKNDEKLKEHEANIKEVKNELKNDSNFMSEDFNFYQKKSVQVLKLEAQRDLMINNIGILQKQLENDSQTKSKQFLNLKDKISKYELSLENLRKIKEMKNKLQEERKEYDKLKIELNEMKNNLDQYKKFITIFFKIYEQKAAEFCGKGFKFKIFDFNDYSLVEIFKVYYNEIEYNNLNSKAKDFVMKTFEEKFLFYD